MINWLKNFRRLAPWGPVFLLGGMFGVLGWGGFNTFMEYTNTMAFCISCHEMRDTVYREYQQSVHYSNAAGVRATCADCHVPRDWTAKLVRKIKATNELYHKLVGSIDTPEKFERPRLVLARKVWAEMEANNSRECRNCHSYDSMNFDKQGHRSREKMQPAMEAGKTCIACHKGVAHKKPYMDDEDD